MNIEDFIKNNCEAFDTEEPLTGHEERFIERLKNRGKKRSKIHHLYYFSAAAVFAGAIIGASFFFSNHHSINEENKCILTGEMKEVQDYYSSALNAEIHNLETVLSQLEPAIKEDVLKDISDLRNSSSNLDHEFCMENGNEKAIGIIVEHYRIKIRKVKSITEFFEQSNHFKPNQS